eukprot:scaffold27601_cov69-Cyclotella_meneghiniana.AAC.4
MGSKRPEKAVSHGVADKNDVSMREMGGGWTCCKVDPPGGSVPNARLDLEGVHFEGIGSE